MPLLYSPLYQSIRLILFGALGLSSLTVNAAINDADTQKTEPLSAASTNSYLSDATNSNEPTDLDSSNDIDDLETPAPTDNYQKTAIQSW